MRNVYDRPVSLELDLKPRLRSRIVSVEPDALDSNYFVAKYEVLNDDRNEYYPFELRVPKDASPGLECWDSVFESVKSFYSRKEDILTYGYRITQQIIEEIFKQTKKAPPKKEAAEKSGDDKPREPMAVPKPTAETEARLNETGGAES